MGETAVIHWRIGSVRILSPPPLFLAVSHWQHSIFLWTLSNFALALHPALSPTHTHKHSVYTHTHTYTSYLALSFPVRHLAITATTTVSHSRFLWSHVLSIPAPSSLSVLHLTPPYLHCLSSLSLDWCVTKCALPIVRNERLILKFVSPPATLRQIHACNSAQQSLIICVVLPPLKHPSLL